MASIEHRGGNKYRITVSCGYDSKGKKIRKYKTITLPENMTERQKDKEIKKQAVLFEQTIENGTYLDGEKITLAEFVDKWLVDYAEKQLAPKTVYEYTKLLENRIIPVLGHIPVGKIQPNHLIEFYNDISENGKRMDDKYRLSEKYIPLLETQRKDINIVGRSTIRNLLKGNVTTKETAEKICNYFDSPLNKVFIAVNKKEKLSNNAIVHYHRVLSTIFTAAVHWQIITDNPCKRVRPPKVDKTEAKHYDEKQVADMFLKLEEADIRHKLAIYIGVFTGVRLGELSALEWSDIDFDNGILKINKERQYLPKKGSFEKKTKTYSSNRVISIPPVLMNLLKQYRKWQNGERLKQGNLWIDTNKIFTQWNGKEIFPSTPSKWFAGFLKKTGMDKITFHQLRHTNASLLIAQGVDVVTVSKRLGHAKTSTTTDIYSHAINKADSDAADKLESLFNTK